MSKDCLKVLIDGELIDATLTTITVPACSMGPAFKRHYYEVNQTQMGYGDTKRDALEMLLGISREKGWLVYQELCESQ